MSSANKNPADPGAGYWRSTVDSKSGRTYYYNAKTKETTWTKPLELASPEEKAEMIRKKEETRKFFDDMERNIKNRINMYSDDQQFDDEKIEQEIITVESAGWAELGPDPIETPFNARNTGRATPTRSDLYNRVRTISSFDDEMLSEFDKKKNNIRNLGKAREALLEDNDNDGEDDGAGTWKDARSRTSGRGSRGSSGRDDDDSASASEKDLEAAMHAVTSTASFDSIFSQAKDDDDSYTHSTQSAMAKDDSTIRRRRSEKVHAPVRRVRKVRRNSTGTIYLDRTMSTQDNKATIHCVCAVIRMHIVEAVKNGSMPHADFEIFNDKVPASGSKNMGNSSRNSSQSNMSMNRSLDSRETGPDDIPSVWTIRDFFELIFSKSQLESECIIMALIYIERLMKETRGKLCLRPNNWRPILFACLVMASKVWDDLSMWNVDFSHVCPSFDLQRVNALEVTILDALKYLIKVSAGEYAKYYFHLRSMMSRLGIKENEPGMLAPLDLVGARQLQLMTENYQSEYFPVENGTTRARRATFDLAEMEEQTAPRVNGGGNPGSNSGSSGGGGGGGGGNRFDVASKRPRAKVGVGLEQITHSAHKDADGMQHATPAVAKHRSQVEFSSRRHNMVRSNSAESKLDLIHALEKNESFYRNPHNQSMPAFKTSFDGERHNSDSELESLASGLTGADAESKDYTYHRIGGGGAGSKSSSLNVSRDHFDEKQFYR